MAGTNRKEMRKLLNKYIALMKVAFDNGLNMSIDTRLNLEQKRPWFTGKVSEEDCDFTDLGQSGVRFMFFEGYEWRTVEENEIQVKLVEKFIEEHKK